MIIYFINIIKKTIYIIFTIIFLSLILSKHSFASDNIFTIEELEVSGQIDLEFSRNNMIENAFESAFDNLLSRILNSSNYKKIGDTSLKEVKHLVESFKIKKEIFRDNKYQAKFDVNFDKKKVIKFLENKNLFFSNPKNISTLFFPIIVEGNKLFLFYDNIFYKKWLIEHDENDLINYIMPLEEIDELPNLIYSQDTIESINMIDVAKKYNTENYILCLIIKKGDELNFYSKINFENNKKNSNLTFDNVNLDSKDSINNMIRNLKIEFNDTWKNFNQVNTSIKLSINLTLNTNDSNEISKFEKILNKIDDINYFSIKKFDLNKTVYTIIYNSNPNKLKNKFSDYGYSLVQKKGYWMIK